MTFEECIDKFKEGYENKIACRTLKAYQKSVRDLVNHVDKPFLEVTRKDIRSWSDHLLGYMKSSSVGTKLCGIKLFYRYCLEERLINKNPAETVPYPAREDKLPYYLKPEQLTQLCKLLEGNKKERTIVEVLYATGVRIDELVNIEMDDINWSERSILVVGKQNKERIVLFTKTCAEHLKTYLEDREDGLPFLFLNSKKNGCIDVRTVQWKFEQYRGKLGFFISPHTLRHTFAAHLAYKGMPLAAIQDLLGHEVRKVTQQYARLYESARKDIYDEWM